MYEFETLMPSNDNELVIKVYDYDRLSTDELMGETRIDLEQRYYSKHRAMMTSGLPRRYDR
jgi:Ca2+-dependent lipid-binding protein